MPSYAPQPWTAFPDVFQNNCYNYALDRRDGTFRQPGERARGPLAPREQANVGAIVLRAVSDGLVPVAEPRCTGTGCWPVALVIAPPQPRLSTGDFHWYRRDDDGFWSHKQGQLPPTQLDDLGHRIVDPATCARGPYLFFGGYFCVCPTQLQL